MPAMAGTDPMFQMGVNPADLNPGLAAGMSAMPARVLEFCAI
jgi:hypothetical protein